MSMTEALRKLLRKMGGSPAAGDNSDELVSKIADVYSGGAGGGLPPYENEDINKVLMLSDSGQSEMETIIAIPEQTVTTNSRNGSAKLDIDTSYWADGQILHLTINGETYDCAIQKMTSEEGPPFYYFKVATDRADQARIITELPFQNFYGNASTTYTVSATIEASIPVPAPTWVKGAMFITLVDKKEGLTADKTPAEVYSALVGGRPIYIYMMGELFPVTGFTLEGGVVAALVATDVQVTANGVQLNGFSLVSDQTGSKYQGTTIEETYPVKDPPA